jgi:hypothetical protein
MEDKEPLLMEISEAVTLFGARMNKRKLYRAVAEKQIPSEIVMHFGTRIYFRRPLLIQWLSGSGIKKNEGKPPGVR